MHDEMFFKTNVENEDFEESLMHYVLAKDPEIQKCMQDYMTKMQAEMNKAASNWGPKNNSNMNTVVNKHSEQSKNLNDIRALDWLWLAR